MIERASNNGESLKDTISIPVPVPSEMWKNFQQNKPNFEEFILDDIERLHSVDGPVQRGELEKRFAIVQDLFKESLDKVEKTHRPDIWIEGRIKLKRETYDKVREMLEEVSWENDEEYGVEKFPIRYYLLDRVRAIEQDDRLILERV